MTIFQRTALTAGTTDVEAIRGWKTLPYIARAYGVPSGTLFAALDILKSGNGRLSVKQVVAKYGRDPVRVLLAIAMTSAVAIIGGFALIGLGGGDTSPVGRIGQIAALIGM